LGPRALPLGIQLVARRNADAALLRLAVAVEELLDFSRHYEQLDPAWRVHGPASGTSGE
jgi:Asp-tRNA(Asn)/Glu-tRNA(Gln) amidotransferase A subunit family amidase